jgi:Coiled-coil domain-containing protein 55 (DUF2040)
MLELFSCIRREDMNIPLAKASNKTKKPRLSMGLNARGGGETNTASVFLSGDDDDEDGHDEVDPTGRAAVNRAIAQEQAALRARAAAAAANQPQDDIYDYDKAYDSFHPPLQDATVQSKEKDGPRQSRYIQDLMQTAAQRQMERDIAQERKVARELTAEEAEDPELRHKERFVTASYRRKLEERKLWQDRQAQLDERDAQPSADGGMAIASFYGNLIKKNGESLKMEHPTSQPEPSTEDNVDGVPPRLNDTARSQNERKNDTEPPVTEQGEEDRVERRKRMRRLREEKVQQARLRYLLRHGLQDSVDATTMAA